MYFMNVEPLMVLHQKQHYRVCILTHFQHADSIYLAEHPIRNWPLVLPTLSKLDFYFPYNCELNWSQRTFKSGYQA